MNGSDSGPNQDCQERPILFETIYVLGRQKLFILCGLAVILAVAYAVLSLLPVTVTAKGFYQISRQVKDFAPETAYRENKVVNLQAVVPDRAKDAKAQEPGSMQNVQGVTIFQPVERKVANMSWEDAATEFFVAYDAYALLARSMTNPMDVGRFLAGATKKPADARLAASVAAAVKGLKPVYAYTEERKIPNQSYRDAVNYVLGVEVVAPAASEDQAATAAEQAGNYLRDRLVYQLLNTFIDGECRLLSTRILDLRNRSLELERKIAMLAAERDELAKMAARVPVSGQTVALGDGKLSMGGPSARAMAVETTLLEARQKADAAAMDVKTAVAALGVFEPLKAISDKTDSGDELYQAFSQAVARFAALPSQDPAVATARNSLSLAERNFKYYLDDVLGFHGTLAAEPYQGRARYLVAAALAGLAVMLVAASLRESFAAYLRRRRAG